MAFGLGLIGEGARADLSLIRSIRNTFAHSRLDISFRTPEIADACRHFTLQWRKPTFVTGKGPCEVFIDVIFQYAMNLIVAANPVDENDQLALEILDLLPPSPETPK